MAKSSSFPKPNIAARKYDSNLFTVAHGEGAAVGGVVGLSEVAAAPRGNVRVCRFGLAAHSARGPPRQQLLCGHRKGFVPSMTRSLAVEIHSQAKDPVMYCTKKNKKI